MKRRFLTASLAILAHACALRAAPGDVDPDFDPGSSGGGFVPGIVRAVVAQTDGKVIIGGGVAEIGGTEVNGIVRLNADGTIDSTFVSGTEFGPVLSIVLQTDGKVLVGGRFTPIDETSRHGVARLNTDGSVDSSFDPGTGGKRGFAVGRVWCVAVQTDGKVLVGGEFTSFNDTARNLIARLNTDGSVDSTFNPGTWADGTILSIAVQTDGKVVVGGDFTTSDGANGIARLDTDGSPDSAFNPGTSAGHVVNSIAVQTDGKLLVGGYQSEILEGLLARLNTDGSLDNTFNPGIDPGHLVNSVAVQADGMVLVGGYETGTRKGMVNRLNADGSLDGTFSRGVEADDLVWAVVVQADGKLLVGGDFGAINGVSQVYVARLFGTPIAAPNLLSIQKADNQVLLNWQNGALSLQSAPSVTGPYTNVPGAISPYTNAITGTQQYFLLKE